MSGREFLLFDTEIGPCGIAWAEHGVIGTQLPEGGERQTRTRMLRRFPDAIEAPPSAQVARAIEEILALLAGKPSDLSVIALDMDQVPLFHRQVYEIARKIPPGVTRTYGEIAHQLGVEGAARAVGQALGRNPFAIVVPCHRVVAAGGKTGGFSAAGGVNTKLKLLAIERAHLSPELQAKDGMLPLF